MEEPQPRKPSGHKKKETRTLSHQPPYFLRSGKGEDPVMTDAVKVQDVQADSTFDSSQAIIYYSLLFLIVGLWTILAWIILAWILSHLHLVVPCFLLPLILWLYSGPMHGALNWAKTRLPGPVA